jgi:hypothetical protein
MLGVIQSADRHEIRNQLLLYKTKGVVQFDKILLIPNAERIQALINLPNGMALVSAALAASIRSSFDSLNLRLTMNTEQILDLADEIIEQSAEDNFGLEDVLLFLQQLITGKAGKIYDRMDIPVFFELFETYRQDRHQALLNIRESQQVNNKANGSSIRSSESDSEEVKQIREVMVAYKKNEFLNGKL